MKFPSTFASSKIENTRSRTNPLESLENTPNASRRESLQGDGCGSSYQPLPSIQELVRGVYTKLKGFLAEEVERLSHLDNELKTPGKGGGGWGGMSICPPLKRLDRRQSFLAHESCDTLFPPKRPFIQ